MGVLSPEPWLNLQWLWFSYFFLSTSLMKLSSGSRFRAMFTDTEVDAATVARALARTTGTCATMDAPHLFSQALEIRQVTATRRNKSKRRDIGEGGALVISRAHTITSACHLLPASPNLSTSCLLRIPPSAPSHRYCRHLTKPSNPTAHRRHGPHQGGKSSAPQAAPLQYPTKPPGAPHRADGRRQQSDAPSAPVC